jgi:hypothetical protein
VRKFLTYVIAIDNVHGKLGKWVGPIIEAESFEEAEEWCKKNTPYLFVDREVLTTSELDPKNNIFISKN